ncbi:MAG: MmgE/PrpD family protein [Proteobacteria bacterium]|nr:MmgE/PrpD family protein [Pseudomonadota bacterium]
MLDAAAPPLTAHRLASFVAGLRMVDVPQRVLERAELSVLDTVAAALGGVPTANARQMRRSGQAFFGAGPCKAWFTDAKMHRAAALLANCAAASALDIDDGHRGASGHPGAAIVPAVLMEANDLGVDGRKILAAVAIGYDIALRIASARLPGTVKTYSSGRWTGYGVAAAIGWLRGLPQPTLVHAMTIAGAEAPENLPAGSYRRLSSVKGSSPWSTLTAAFAVERAIAGADGPEDSLDRASVYDPAAIHGDLGSRWLIEETYLKPYASCRYTHPSIDAVLNMVGERPPSPTEIHKLEVEVFPEAFTITNERHPATLESAQFSIPFCLALATLRGAAAFRPLTEGMLRDSEVLELSDRVEMTVGPDLVGTFPAMTASRVRLRLDRGEAQCMIRTPLGDTSNPMGRTQVEQKMLDLSLATRNGIDIARSIAGDCGRLLTGDVRLVQRL